jgi:hypothetical protein
LPAGPHHPIPLRSKDFGTSYQLVPLLMALRLPVVRLLIADDVLSN